MKKKFTVAMRLKIFDSFKTDSEGEAGWLGAHSKRIEFKVS